MKQKDFIGQLKSAFSQDERSTPSERFCGRSRKLFLRQLRSSAHHEKSDLDLRSLMMYYRSPSSFQQNRIKRQLMNVISEDAQISSISRSTGLFLYFSRPAFSLLMVLILFSVLVLDPFHQVLLNLDFLPKVKAAYLDCIGKVYLNDEICHGDGSFLLAPGDTIRTTMASTATILYNDYSLVRLDGSTEVSLAKSREESLYLGKGQVWLHSPLEFLSSPLVLETPVLKTQITRGAVGVKADDYVTHLYTTNSSVEVQVSDQKGVTELLTISPDSSIAVRMGSRKTRVKDTVAEGEQQVWVDENRDRDARYLELVKIKTLEDQMVDAGVLPGGVQDYVGKVVSSVRSALAWDSESRYQLLFRELNELFAETLVLFENDDEAKAFETFAIYELKISLLIDRYQKSLSSQELTKEGRDLIKLVETHVRLLSSFLPQDPQYPLKDSFQALAYRLMILGKKQAQRLVSLISSQQLLDVSIELSEGNISLAEQILSKTAEFVQRSASSFPIISTTKDIDVLNYIVEKAPPHLKALARQIKKDSIVNLQLLTPDSEVRQVHGSSVVGTAYKLSDREDMANQKTMKIVGHAFQEGS